MKFEEYGFHTVAAPTIVNYAFSVELALKLIHSLALGTSATGHDLELLYRKLPNEITVNLPHLSDCVVEIARYFEDWRYPFEKPFLFGDYENPRRAFIECYREIRQLRPEMASIYESLWGAFEPEWLQPGSDQPPRWELRRAGG
jgi:HEPN domain-containing protein